MVILLVSDDDRRLNDLSGALRAAGSVLAVHNFRKAAQVLAETRTPALVFSDMVLADGGWEEVLGASKRAPKPVDVVVVSDTVDDDLFSEALDRGAFDFVTPPFDPNDLAYIVRSAEWDLAKRVQNHDRAA